MGARVRKRGASLERPYTGRIDGAVEGRPDRYFLDATEGPRGLYARLDNPRAERVRCRLLLAELALLREETAVPLSVPLRNARSSVAAHVD
jgi:hypothetical protein